MSGPPGIGIDLKSLLKSIKSSCELALKAFDGDFDANNPAPLQARFQAAAVCLSAIEELIGGGRLQLYIEICKGAAKRRER